MEVMLNERYEIEQESLKNKESIKTYAIPKSQLNDLTKGFILEDGLVLGKGEEEEKDINAEPVRRKVVKKKKATKPKASKKETTTPEVKPEATKEGDDAPTDEEFEGLEE